MKGGGRILVVTPTLGVSPYLEETVISVARQPIRLRHVLVAPAARVGALQERFPGATVMPDAGPKAGLYGALNSALGASGGEWDWFTYINDDDSLRPGFAAAATRHLLRPHPEGVAYGEVELSDEEGRTISLVTTEPNPRRIPALLQQGISPLMQQGMLVHREIVRWLGGFDLRYRLCADLDFWLRAYASGARFRFYPMVVAAFRLRTGQLSGDTSLTRAEQDEIVARHLPDRISGWSRLGARLLFRLRNLPRYFTRLQRRGWRTSYQLLEGEEENERAA